MTGRPERFDGQVLTPRTPHSRSGRAEEGRTAIELDELRSGDFDEDPFLTTTPLRQQSESLLHPSERSSLPAGYRSRGDDHDILSRKSSDRAAFALVRRFMYISGSFMICGILAMFMMAFKRSQVEDNLSAMQRPVISYDGYARFPLSGAQYKSECEKLVNYTENGSYWAPSRNGPLDVPHAYDTTEGGQRICSKSITYLLDEQSGFTTDLALIVQVARLAQEQNRTFLVDDSRWNQGKWTDYFMDVRLSQTDPEPGCQAPPPEELVACPRTARHWVISSQTAPFHLGNAFRKAYEDSSARGISRQKPLYDRALRSFATTIRPNAQVGELIHAARSEIASILSLPNVSRSSHSAAPYIGLHIRGGDHKAASSPDHRPSVHLEEYIRIARDTWTRLYPDWPLAVSSTTAVPQEPAHFPSPPITYLASDAPEALRDFVGAFPSSTAIFALDLSTNPDLRALAPQHAYVEEDFVTEDEEERIALTRGMIVDLALLSGLWAINGDVVPGATICTASSNVCQLSAVGLGWNRAFGFDDGVGHEEHDVEDARRRWVTTENQGAAGTVWKGFEMPQ